MDLYLMFIFCKFASPKPNQRPDLVLMSTPLPVQGPRTRRRTSGCGPQVFLPGQPPPSLLMPGTSDWSHHSILFQKSKVGSGGTKFNSEYFLTDFVYFPHCKLWNFSPRGHPLRLQKMYKNLLSATGNFSVRPPAAQHQKSEKNPKNTKKNFFNPDGFL